MPARRYTNYKSINQNQMTEKERESVDRKPKSRSIPVDVVIGILSWLPFKTLQRFKCVCRFWLYLLTNDTYFGKLHCARVMAELACRYDYQMGETSYFGLQSDEGIPQAYDQDFFEEVYQCFYGNSRSYSFQKVVWRLNASGFTHQPQAMLQYRKASFCDGLYVICARMSIWFGYFWLYGPLYYRCHSTLVLAPTTEAARDLMMSMPYDSHVCVDGNSVLEGHLLLLSGKKVVVGTPGCVFEILPTHSIGPDCIKEFVLYNADELFARGFKDKIYNIFKLLHRKVRVVIISERMPREALEIPQQFWNQKGGQWNIDTRSESSEKANKSNRSLWVERSAQVKLGKELVTMKAMWKSGKPEQIRKKSNSWNPHLKRHY